MAATDIGIELVREAARWIEPYAHRTPTATCTALDERAGRRLVFKCEQFQKIGAFKFRGACHAIMRLSDDDAARGVVTQSSGNHAQAVALASRLRGVEAHIVMPKNASPVKLAAVRDYGARIIPCEPNGAAREAMTRQTQQDTGATLIHPYDNAHVIAGQGTATLELLQQAGELDAVICPVGGGGLLAGACVAAKGMNPGIRVFAAEPLGADDAARSLATGKRQPQEAPDTIADGLLTSLGELNWAIIQRDVEQVITVTDQQIVEAMRLCWQRAKLLIEPSAAVAVAAVLSDAFKQFQGLERVGVILSGGNVDIDNLPWAK